MSIYTKSGDKGMTRIHGGERIPKDHIRIEANGTIDELNSMIGVVRAFLDDAHEWQEILYKVQKELMVAMSMVATPSHLIQNNPNEMDPEFVTWMECLIDKYRDAIGEESRYFILPGGNLISSHLQLARTIARRAERQLWSLNKEDKVAENILILMNRLSDLLFIMARYEMYRQGAPEERWHHFLYKRKSKK